MWKATRNCQAGSRQWVLTTVATMVVVVGVVADIVAGLVGRTTDMRMEEVAAVVDDRVADVKVEEATVVMEAMVEVAEEEEVEDGEGHQVVGRVAATTGGEIKQNPLQVVVRGF